MVACSKPVVGEVTWWPSLSSQVVCLARKETVVLLVSHDHGNLLTMGMMC